MVCGVVVQTPGGDLTDCTGRDDWRNASTCGNLSGEWRGKWLIQLRA
jgi:hypothetical protein